MKFLNGKIKMIFVSAAVVLSLGMGVFSVNNRVNANEKKVMTDEQGTTKPEAGKNGESDSKSDVMQLYSMEAVKNIWSEKLEEIFKPIWDGIANCVMVLAEDEELKSETVDAAGNASASDIETTASIPLDDSDERYIFITGDVKQKYHIDQMPMGYRYDSEARERMTTITVPVWKLNDDWTRREGEMQLTVNSLLADDVKCIFEEIYALDIQFPIRSMLGYTYRKVGGVGLVDSTLMSAHAFGVAIDINPDDYDNDYFLGKGNDLRNKDNPYCIPDEVIEIFKSHGWYWGGEFEICADTMHFQYFDLDFLEYECEDPNEPFPILQYGASGMNGTIISNMQQRLVRLGYLEKATGRFNRATEEAVKAFQEAEGMEADGIVDYKTWERLINLTHMMEYVF